MPQAQNVKKQTSPQRKGASQPLPVGEVFQADTNAWYNLQVNYTDKDGKPQTGFLGPVSNSGVTANWADMLVGGEYTSKFKLHPRSDGWFNWEIDDGYYLSVHEYTERFFFREDYDPDHDDNNVGWNIIDGKLHNNYYVNKPAGCEWWSFGDVVAGYYAGCELSNGNVFTCKLVPTSAPEVA